MKLTQLKRSNDRELHNGACRTMGPADRPDRQRMWKASTPPKHIEALVNQWAGMGMYLPDDETISFLRINFSDVKTELADAVKHEKSAVRQRAAYVIGKIGPVAISLGPDLVHQLKIENEGIVRMYLATALARVNFKDQEAIGLLQSQFESLSSDNTAPQLLGGYPDIDEKINVAAALYSLTDNDDRRKYLDFVTQWLKPPSAELSIAEIDGYWERRWMAVIALEHMPDASSAIPLLEALLQERGVKSWVSVHVPRVLGVLRSSNL